MANYKNYVVAQSLEEAYTLNQKRSSVIVAGNMWLRMCKMSRQTAVDLSQLGLDRIERTDEGIRIGAMTTLRQMETSKLLLDAFGDVFAKAFAPIVGTQFRNGATIGGSVYSRFGFSDVSTLLLAMRAKVVLYKRGTVDLDAYQKETWDRDILTHIVIPVGQRAAIESVRNSATDLPVLVCAAAADENGMVRVVLGSRPARAMVAADGLRMPVTMAELERIASEVAMGSNMRAEEAYRRKVAPVLMQRAVYACAEGKNDAD